MDEAQIDEILSTKSVLFVDDDEYARNYFSKILEYFFAKVFVASDGLQAIEQYKQNSIDVVISDITMPEMGGVEMASKLKAIDPNLRILFITGQAKDEVDEMCLPYGSFLIKPVSIEEIFEKVIALF
jgi:CheY-like chemotaxis protein